MKELLEILVELLGVVPFHDENGDSTTNDLIETVFYSENFDWLVENKLHETRHILKRILLKK